jgi:signal transduction histidine kinase/CheY-like chemotaxis protein
MFLAFSNKLNDVSISRKLYFTISFTALLITIELCTLWFSITTLSAVRSYVGGEGLWSKAQKDAIMNLREYAHTHNEKDYVEFKNFLAVPYGDKAARIELEKANPDFNIARQALLKGRNHPDDIDGMMKLLRRFHNVYYLKKAFTAWANAEPALEELIKIGEKLHVLVSNNVSEVEIAVLLKDIDRINGELTKLEDDFSFTLGEGARWLEALVLKVVLALSLTIGTATILLAISINKNLKKGLDAIVEGADNIRKGDFKKRVPVYSKDEIGMLATSFNEMMVTLDQNIRELKLTEQNLTAEKERAEQSEKAKQHFLINMSHEIRTPMNAILGFARHLEESMVTEDQKESLRMIMKSGDHLLIIFNDILDFSRIGAGEINFMVMPFNITETLQSIFMLTEPNARFKKIGLSYTIDPNVPKIAYGDSVRLTQILLNLTSNAIKFTESGGVVISVVAVEENEKQVVIEFSIRDTGIGIPLEKQEKIFDVFEQAVSGTSRKFGGTGIGLSIVKQLVTLQNGSISINSQPGQGSEFSFRLPFLKFEDQTGSGVKDGHSVENGSSDVGKGVKVLIVEDNAINQLLVLKLLKKHGYETSVAENGKIALHKYWNADFDIILMDLQMPEMDGYETTVNIRKMGMGKGEIPIVAMTAHTIKGELERCMAIGMDDYISKPFQSSELYEKIHRLVKKKLS